jgi:hypothetical protein
MKHAKIILGALPDNLLYMQKKKKSIKEKVAKSHAKKQSFWYKATGGRMN